MSSARSTVPDNGNGYKQANRVVPSSNEPVFVPKLPKKPSDGIEVGSRPEGKQDHESTPQPSGSADWTHRNVQEGKKIKNETSSSYYSYPPNTRGGTNPNPVVAAQSSTRAEGPPASQPRSFAENAAALPKVEEQRGTNERPQARGYPTHRNSEEKENKAALSVSRPMYGGQSSSSPPAASTQSSTQAPNPRTSPSNPPIHNVNATPKDGVAAYTGTPQRAAQRTTGFDHASTPGGGSGNRENTYTSTVSVARLNELGKQAPYTSGTGVSRSDAPSQNQTTPNSAPVGSRAPPLPPPTSRPNRRDEQKLNAPPSLPLSSSVGTRDQLGSESIVTTTPTPFGKPSAPQLPQTRTYQNPSGSASTFQQRGITEERATQERPPGNPQSGSGLPYARGHNLNAPANPTSQPGRSDEKRPDAPFSPPFSGLPKNEYQDYVGSGSTVAPVREPSAPQPRKPWSSSHPSGSVAPQQLDAADDWTAQEPLSGKPTNAGSLYNQTRGYTSTGQPSSSNEVPPPSSYPTPVSPTPPTAPLYPTLAAITGGNSGSKQPKSKGNDFQVTAPASQSNETRGQGVGRGGNSANTSAIVDLPSGNAERSAGAREHKGKSSEQNNGRTLESFMANHPSLNVTSELDVQPPFATGVLVDVHSGVCRKRKVFVKVLRSYEGWRVDPQAGASSKPHITTEMPKWATLKHQNVCEFFGYSTRFGPYPALVYAWCGGDTVFEYLRGRHLPVEQRIRLAQDVAEGLQYLHENDIVHGDLTLKNVLVDDSGVAQLCDIGLAQLAEWQQPIEPTEASNYSGRDRYRAPELSSGPASVATFESDVYSLGCILLKFVEELNPFDGVQDVAKHKRKTPPAPPARRKDKTNVLLGMASFFWNQLEACWEEPAKRPKTYKIVENLQTLANKFPLTQSEQIESPPPYPAPVSEPVDKTALNYGPSVSIPAQPPVEVNFSLGSTRDLLTGRATPTRPPPRTEGSAGLSNLGQTSNTSVYIHGSRGAGYQPSSTSLYTQGSRAGGYEVAERRIDPAGGPLMARDEPPESHNPTVAPRASFARDRSSLESSGPTRPFPLPGTRDPPPAESLPTVPARGPSSATVGGGGGGASDGRGRGGNNTATARAGWDKANDLEGGGLGGGTTSTAQDDANSGPCSCCVLC